MRCPKCHYLSFDPEPRCKNCGYDLEVADADLALRTAESNEESLPDLTLHERPAPAQPPVTLEMVRAEPEPEKIPEPRLSLVEAAPSAPPAPPAAPQPRSPFRAPHTTAELPLFVKGLADRDDFSDEDTPERPAPPISMPPSRPPLAVRRAVPEPARMRPKPAERRLGPLDHDLLEDLKRVEHDEAVQARAEARAIADDVREAERVEPLQRVAAAAIDTAVLGGIAMFVFWATLRLCNVSLSGLGLAALAPLLLFLAMIDLGYLLMFTAAGGQTVGKMLMRIRVVGDSAEDGAHISVRRAAWRSVLALVSVVSLGLAWLPALVGRGLTLHDRLAHTRVVRV